MAAQKVVLVTGGTGLVGTGVQRVIQERGASETAKWVFLGSKDGDLTKFEDVKAIFEKHRPTHILHLAAHVGGLYANMAYQVDFWRDNTMMQDNIMQLANEYNVEKLVSCLSTCIFPDKTTYPIDETMIHDGPPHFSNEGYAYAKRMVDVQNRLYERQYGRKWCSVVPTNVFGEGDNFSLTDGHVIPALIHKCYNSQKSGEPFMIFGSGKPLRQFIYNYDLARLMVWVVEEYTEVEPIILCGDEKDEVSIGDVANMIVKAMEFKGEVKYDTSKADGQFKKTASNVKLRKYLPDFDFTPMDGALDRTCKWFVANYETARK